MASCNLILVRWCRRFHDSTGRSSSSSAFALPQLAPFTSLICGNMVGWRTALHRCAQRLLDGAHLFGPVRCCAVALAAAYRISAGVAHRRIGRRSRSLRPFLPSLAFTTSRFSAAVALFHRTIRSYALWSTHGSSHANHLANR